MRAPYLASRFCWTSSRRLSSCSFRVFSRYCLWVSHSFMICSAVDLRDFRVSVISGTVVKANILPIDSYTLERNGLSSRRKSIWMRGRTHFVSAGILPISRSVISSRCLDTFNVSDWISSSLSCFEESIFAMCRSVKA